MFSLLCGDQNCVCYTTQMSNYTTQHCNGEPPPPHQLCTTTTSPIWQRLLWRKLKRKTEKVAWSINRHHLGTFPLWVNSRFSTQSRTWFACFWWSKAQFLFQQKSLWKSNYTILLFSIGFPLMLCTRLTLKRFNLSWANSSSNAMPSALFL